jgi:hypothetical protein
MEKVLRNFFSQFSSSIYMVHDDKKPNLNMEIAVYITIGMSGDNSANRRRYPVLVPPRPIST